MSAATVARARACIGAPFRLHGRDPATGLDCVGLAAIALGVPAPATYARRTADFARIVAAARAAGLTPVPAPTPGTLLVLRAGPGQLHLAIATDRGFVHADARARRVVERPGAPPWPLLGGWHCPDPE